MRASLPTLLGRMGRHPLTAEIGRQLVSRCGWVPGGTIAVACSGGVDSCVLLAACAAIARRRSSRGKVFAIHVHHHLRAEADGDADHVGALAREIDVPLVRRDVRPTRRGRGLADDARNLRHAALHEGALEVGAGHIAVAHHADDRLETLLMRLGRGAGLRGLASIPWSRQASRGSAVRLARPMLGLTRAEIVSCARDVGLAWRDDPGNEDPSSVRGLLRTSVIPALRARWPAIAKRASASADAARAGLAASTAWSRARSGRACPTRSMLRAAGPDLACIMVDAWLRGIGVHATWRQVARIGHGASGPESAPRMYPAGLGQVEVRAREIRFVAPP